MLVTRDESGCSRRFINPPAVTCFTSLNVAVGSMCVDFVGPFVNSMFLLVGDAYMKWLEVCP